MSKSFRIVLSLVLFLITAAPVPLGTPLYSEETPEVELSNLPADPQRVEFQAEDGKNLVGYYYASKYANSPIVVLMHWAGGDQRDWCRIAPWLQNRLDENPAEMEGCPEPPGTLPQWDPTWFPPMPEDASLSVFTFDFRDYGESDKGLGTSSNWTLDAKAAYLTAAGVEANLMEQSHQGDGLYRAADDASVVEFLRKIVGGGTSIGADAVVTGLLRAIEALMSSENASGEWPNGAQVAALEIFPGLQWDGRVQTELVPVDYAGAFSWSPGNYNGNNYTEDVKNLMEFDPPVPVWCLAGEADGQSSPTCKAAEEYLDRMHLVPGSGEHGARLIRPDYDPNTLELFLEFLELTVGLGAEEEYY